MRRTSNRRWATRAVLTLQCLLAATPLAAESQTGADRWVPSFSIVSGILAQDWKGSADSVLFQGGTPPPVPLRGVESRQSGDDLAIEPFVGVNLELMSPSLPIPSRPRFFVSGEFLPTFAANRSLAVQGDPDCVSGPEPEALCASEEDGSRNRPFDEDSANGQGTIIEAEIDTPVFGASVGVAFPFEVLGRKLRIKPSAGWIHYKVKAEGLVVDATCPINDACTPYSPIIGDPDDIRPGFLRETRLKANDSRHFDAVGPGLDVEMDAVQFGPVGTALFLGARAYRVLGDRKIKFGTEEQYNDLAGNDIAAARFEAEVDKWMYRGHVGIRFQWLGSASAAGDR